jgi:hypothetical protein
VSCSARQRLEVTKASASFNFHSLVGIFDRILEKIPPQFGVHFRVMTAARYDSTWACPQRQLAAKTNRKNRG